MKKARRFWLSWSQPTNDFRPLTDPPEPGVLGWWCSGYDASNYATLCALVEASTIQGAKAIVRRSWPEAPPKAEAWRIEDERLPDWLPGDRFPIDKGWMQERIEKAQQGQKETRP